LVLPHLLLPWNPSSQSYLEVLAHQVLQLDQDYLACPFLQLILLLPWFQSFQEFLEAQGILAFLEDLEDQLNPSFQLLLFLQQDQRVLDLQGYQPHQEVQVVLQYPVVLFLLASLHFLQGQVDQDYHGLPLHPEVQACHVVRAIQLSQQALCVQGHLLDLASLVVHLDLQVLVLLLLQAVPPFLQHLFLQGILLVHAFLHFPSYQVVLANQPLHLSQPCHPFQKDQAFLGNLLVRDFLINLFLLLVQFVLVVHFCLDVHLCLGHP